MIKRKTDDTYYHTFERTERFYRLGVYWYFKTREAIDYGPFTSKEQAEIELQRFLDIKMMVHDIRSRWRIH